MVAIDVTKLRSTTVSLDEDVAIHLIDIDPNSPYRGERIPLQWDYQQDATNWQPENFLSLAPVWGFPLRPRHVVCSHINHRHCATR